MTYKKAFEIVRSEQPVPADKMYPTLGQVQIAIAFKDGISILRWHRFLPRAENDYQRIVLQKIEDALLGVGCHVFDA